MKQEKRIIAIVLACLLVFSGISRGNAAQVQAAKKKVKVSDIRVTNCNTGTVTIAKGKSFTLKPAVTPLNASNKKVSYSSSNRTVADVNGKGKVTARKTGKTKITIKAKDGSKKKATVTVKVVGKKKYKAATKISFGQKSYSVTEGSVIKTQLIFKPARVSNKNIVYQSSDKKVASIDANGKITGVRAGTAKITATATDGSKKKATVTVVVREPDGAVSSEMPDSEIKNSETSGSETTNSEEVNSEMPDSETPNSEVSNSETTNSETPDSETEIQEELFYAEKANVILWNAVDALLNTSYARAENGSTAASCGELFYQWQQAEDGKSIQLCGSEGSSTEPVVWAEGEENAPYLLYKVRTEQAGDYYFSFYANSPNRTSDSFHVIVNDNYCYTTNTREVISNGSDDEGGAAGERWFVCNLKKVTLQKGENTVKIAACESGVLFRQFRLSRQNPVFLLNQWQETTGLAADSIILEIEDLDVEVDYGKTADLPVTASTVSKKAASVSIANAHPDIAAAEWRDGFLHVEAKKAGVTTITVTAEAAGCVTLVEEIGITVKEQMTGAAQAGAPTDLMAALAGETSDAITITWDKPGGREGVLADYADVTGYRVYCNGKPIGESDADSTYFTAENLMADTEYVFQVGALRARREAKTAELHVFTDPAGTVLNVTEYGAGTDKTARENAIAIQKAIDSCPENGTVYIPAGTYQSGAIDLKSNMTLRVDGVLKGSVNPKDYLALADNYPQGHVYPGLINDDGLIYSRYEGWEIYCYRSLINVGYINPSNRREVTCENVTICGAGEVNGGGTSLLNRCTGDSAIYGDGTRYPEYVSDNIKSRRTRGRLICFHQAKDVLVKDVGIKNPPCWTLHMIYCDTMSFFGLTIYSTGVRNGDGWDPDSSRNLMIFNCEFETGDDCIAIKSGKNMDGNIVNLPTENVRIFDLEMNGGLGMAIGSEQSGGVLGVYIRDLRQGVTGHTRYGLELKAANERGGYIKDLLIVDSMLDQFLAHSVTYNADGDAAPKLPVFSGFTVRNSVITGYSGTSPLATVITLDGFASSSHADEEKEHYIHDVVFENVALGEEDNFVKSVSIAKSRDLVFTNVTQANGSAPKYVLANTVDASTVHISNDLPEFDSEIEGEKMLTGAVLHDGYQVSADASASDGYAAELKGQNTDSLCAKYTGGTAEAVSIVYFDAGMAEYKLYLDENAAPAASWTGTSTSAWSEKTVVLPEGIQTGTVIRIESKKVANDTAKIDKVMVGKAPSEENDTKICLDGTYLTGKTIAVERDTTVEGLLQRITSYLGGTQRYAVYEAKDSENALKGTDLVWGTYILRVTSQDGSRTAEYVLTLDIAPRTVSIIGLATGDDAAQTAGSDVIKQFVSYHNAYKTVKVDTNQGITYLQMSTPAVHDVILFGTPFALESGGYLPSIKYKQGSARGTFDILLVAQDGSAYCLGSVNEKSGDIIATGSLSEEAVQIPEGNYRLAARCKAAGDFTGTELYLTFAVPYHADEVIKDEQTFEAAE